MPFFVTLFFRHTIRLKRVQLLYTIKHAFHLNRIQKKKRRERRKKHHNNRDFVNACAEKEKEDSRRSVPRARQFHAEIYYTCSRKLEENPESIS